MLTSIFLFVLFFLLIVIVAAIALLRQFFRVTGLSTIFKLLRGQPVDFNSSARGNSTGHSGFSSSSSSRTDGFQERQTRTASGNIIIDRRDPTTANRKIFQQDEGEYVDFTEEA